LIRRALGRAQRHGIASRRRRGLNSAVMQARFGCQQLRPRGIDVLPFGRRIGRLRQQHTMVRRRDTRVRAVTPVHRDTRASDRVARQKQQERHGKQAHQDTRRCRRHVCGCALTSCSNVRGSAPPIKRQLTDRFQLRRIKSYRGVDASAASASACTILRRKPQMLLGVNTRIDQNPMRLAPSLCHLFIATVAKGVPLVGNAKAMEAVFETSKGASTTQSFE
jgi:hypothetical protein